MCQHINQILDADSLLWRKRLFLCFSGIWIMGSGKFGSNPHILLAPPYFTFSNGCVTLWKGLHAFDLFRRFALTSSPPPTSPPPEHKILLSRVNAVSKKVPSVGPTWHERPNKRNRAKLFVLLIFSNWSEIGKSANDISPAMFSNTSNV